MRKLLSKLLIEIAFKLAIWGIKLDKLKCEVLVLKEPKKTKKQSKKKSRKVKRGKKIK